jgi:hypothetical protein
LESDKYSFPLAKRTDDAAREKAARCPGPGEYEVLTQLPKGQSKSILGGPIKQAEIRDNGVPAPGHYNADTAADYLYHIPGVKIIRPTEKPEKDKDEDKKLAAKDKRDTNVKHKYQEGYSFGRGLREPIKNKFHTPAPDAYNVVDFPNEDKKDGKVNEKKYKFHMGMRTEYKANRGQETPGPGEHYPEIYEKPTISHVIGTGHRSDLGVGKAYMAPGPGEYEVRGKIDGPHIKFGNQAKDTKIKKTYEPGPANYDLPSTVGNIPRYIRLKQERELLDRIVDRPDDIELL